MLGNLLVLLIIALIIAGASYKLIADKKRGVKCSGCPYSEVSKLDCHCCDQPIPKPIP